MNRELLDRIRDQARTEMGFCVQAKDGNWCDRHEALKFPGEEACRVLSVAYVVAEAAVEVAEPLIRADEREQDWRRHWRYGAARTEVLADLRAKVERLDRWPVDGGRRLVIHREEVIALIDEAQP